MTISAWLAAVPASRPASPTRHAAGLDGVGLCGVPIWLTLDLFNPGYLFACSECQARVALSGEPQVES